MSVSAFSLLPGGQPFGDPVPSGRAAVIVRGVQLMLAQDRWATLTEVTLASGRRADIMALSPKGGLTIIEVKSCLQDFATDQKWPEYRPWCDRFLFAVDCDFPRERIPDEAGLIVADGYGGAILREPEPHPLVAARRKAVTLSFARLAAARLLRSGLAGGSDAGAAEPAPEPVID